MLEHIAPWEYHEVRRVLGHGSGFDSPGFRRFGGYAGPVGGLRGGARARGADGRRASARRAATAETSTSSLSR